jgi:hypothetical protein
VWGRGNISASVHEGTKWYCISVEHAIFFFIVITIYFLLLLLSKLMLVLYWELCLYCNCKCNCTRRTVLLSVTWKRLVKTEKCICAAVTVILECANQ